MLKNILENNDNNRLVKMRHGWMVYNKNDQYIGASIEKYGEFSHGEMELFTQVVGKGGYIIEVGANIGAHTLALSKLIGDTGKIFAYEPQSAVYQILCANMALNSCSNAYCFHQAASDQHDLITIPDIDYSKKGNFGGISIENFTSGRPVQVVVLDEELADIPQLNLLKIDVEGMEFKVLSGAKKLIKKHRPILYVENDRLEKSQELIELIQSMGYRLYWHTPWLYNSNNFAGDKENIFGKIWSINMVCLHNTINKKIVGMTEILDSTSHPMKKK